MNATVRHAAKLIAFTASLQAAFNFAAQAEFRDDLAKYFNTDPQYLFLNLPPRPGGWPGSIYSNDMRFSFVRGDPNDRALGRGPEYNLANSFDLDVSSGFGAKIVGLFGLDVGLAKTASVQLEITRARTYDLTISQMRARLQKLPAAQRKPPGPVIVYRAYEGVFVLQFIRSSSADATAWGRLQAKLMELRGKAEINQSDKLSISSREPIIFAFEVARVDDVSAVDDIGKAVGCYGDCGGSIMSTTGAAKAATDLDQFGGPSNVSAVLEHVARNPQVRIVLGFERVPALPFENVLPKN